MLPKSVFNIGGLMWDNGPWKNEDWEWWPDRAKWLDQEFSRWCGNNFLSVTMIFCDDQNLPLAENFY